MLRKWSWRWWPTVGTYTLTWKPKDGVVLVFLIHARCLTIWDNVAGRHTVQHHWNQLVSNPRSSAQMANAVLLDHEVIAMISERINKLLWKSLGISWHLSWSQKFFFIFSMISKFQVITILLEYHNSLKHVYANILVHLGFIVVNLCHR